MSDTQKEKEKQPESPVEEHVGRDVTAIAGRDPSTKERIENPFAALERAVRVATPSDVVFPVRVLVPARNVRWHGGSTCLGYYAQFDSAATMIPDFFDPHAMFGCTAAIEVDLSELLDDPPNDSLITRELKVACPRRAPFYRTTATDQPRDAMSLDALVPGVSADDVLGTVDPWSRTEIDHDAKFWRPYLDEKGYAGLYRSADTENSGLLVVSCRSTLASEQLWHAIVARQKHVSGTTVTFGDMADSAVIAAVADGTVRNTKEMLFCAARGLGFTSLSAAHYAIDTRAIAKGFEPKSPPTRYDAIEACAGGKVLAIPDHLFRTDVVRRTGDLVEYFSDIVPLKYSDLVGGVIGTMTSDPTKGVTVVRRISGTARQLPDWIDPGVFYADPLKHPDDRFAPEWTYMESVDPGAMSKVDYRPISVIGPMVQS